MSFKSFSDGQKSAKPDAANDAAKPSFASDKAPVVDKKATPPKTE